MAVSRSLHQTHGWARTGQIEHCHSDAKGQRGAKNAVSRSLHQIRGCARSGGGRPLGGGRGQPPAAPEPSGGLSSAALPLPLHLPHATWPTMENKIRHLINRGNYRTL